MPTAMARVATNAEEAADALDTFGAPYVVKDDGLAAGKGVVVTDDRDAALAHAQSLLATPGGTVVIEEFLDGPEVSLFVLCDGAARWPCSPGAGLQARSATATRAPTPAAWAPTRRWTGPPTASSQEVLDRVAQPTVNRDGAPRHPVRRRALRAASP